MGELKPIGSEKLKGDEKIQRILDLTYYQTNIVLKESKKGSVEATKEGKTGIYGIEKEKDGYYVKKGLNENSLDYIGGMFMKNKNRFTSYNEALKKMEFLIEQEIADSKVLEEATKYVLKQPKAPVAPAAEESVAPPPAPEAAPMDAVSPEGDAPLADEGGELPDENVEDPNDYMKVLKKLAGKLQEKINKYEDKLESSDYKEIIKQILSAVDLEKLEESDIDEIISVFEEDDIPTDDMGGEPVPDENVPVEAAETDDIDGIASLDELINTPLEGFDEFDDEDELSGFDSDFLNDPEIEKAGKMAKQDSGDDFDEYFKDVESFPVYKGGVDDEESIDEELPMGGLDTQVQTDGGMGSTNDDVRELDLDELTNMVNSSVKETLGKYFE